MLDHFLLLCYVIFSLVLGGFMKKLVLVVLALLITSPSFATNIKFGLSKKVYHNKDISFVPHSDEGPLGSYLTMNVNFPPVSELFFLVLIHQGFSLQNRGEAHITVITPIEFNNVLQPMGVTIDEINKIAHSKNIQSSKFEVECLGRGKADIEGKTEKTFYIVVTSEDLIEIREKVHSIFVNKGGDPHKFKPRSYYPHITVGFTRRDLHESDEVIKNLDSCWADLKLHE